VTRGWRGLAGFWGALLLLAAAGAAVLQLLGPLPQPDRPPAHAAAAPGPSVAATVASPPSATVAPPDPALLEPSATFPGGDLPRRGAAGLVPARAYAAPFDAADPHPRVAILLGGIGMDESDSEEAVHTLPGAISLAVTPYAWRPERLLAAARGAGHEIWLALPLEPARYPIDDAGDHALLTGNLPALNQQRLEWALTRFDGYVGATGALGGLRGERFAAAHELMDPLLQVLAARGLLYIDPRPGAPHPPFVTGRSVDVVIDEPPVRTEIEANLARLEQIAHDRGAALGLAGAPRPVTLDRLGAWAATLPSRGLVLAPVSALAEAPPPRPAAAAAEETHRP
jgi:polysaccharide deacetylase 2 family uncharacterized protein YibQ